MSDINSSTQESSQELTTTSTNTTAPPSEDDRIDAITTEILQHKNQVACSFIRIGQLLDEAKGHLKKDGLWLKWLEAKVDISVRMAQRYIQLAQAFPDATSISHLGVTKALALLALPEAKRELFLNELHEVNGEMKQIGDMSVREIQTAIREQTKPPEKPAEDTTESAGTSNEADTASKGPNNGSEEANKHMKFRPVLNDPDDSDPPMRSRNRKNHPSQQVQSRLPQILNRQITNWMAS